MDLDGMDEDDARGEVPREPTNTQLEGRLIAQRQVIAQILATLPEDAAKDVWDLIERRSVFQSHEEDPGAVPTGAMAIEAALSDEMRVLGEEARRRQERARAG